MSAPRICPVLVGREHDLELLARRLVAARVAILCTMRTDETGDGLGQFLLTVRRGRRVRLDLHLAPLRPEDVARMMEALLQRPVAPLVATMVHERTGGNPFFVEEVVAASTSATDGRWLPGGDLSVPPTVQQAVLRQLDGLAGSAQEVVSWPSRTRRAAGAPR